MINDIQFILIKKYQVKRDYIHKVYISNQSYKRHHPFLKIDIIVPKYIKINFYDDEVIYKLNKKKSSKYGSIGLIAVYIDINDENNYKTLKCMNFSFNPKNIINYKKVILNEINFYKNISQLYDYPKYIISVDFIIKQNILDTEYCYIFMDYYKNNLDDIIVSLPIRKHEKLISNIANGLKELKKLKIIHNDLKTANILCDRKLNIFLIDFNCVTYNNSDSNLVEDGTDIFLSPQVILNQTNCYKLYSNDIWAFGIIIYQIISGINCNEYISKTDKPNLRNFLFNYIISKGEKTFDLKDLFFGTDEIIDKYTPIINKCFTFNSKTRITIEDVVKMI